MRDVRFPGFARVVLFRCVAAILLVAPVGLTSEHEKPKEKPGNGKVDFTGTWRLDLEASRSKALDEIMSIQGLNRVERAMANVTVVTQIIRQDSNDALHIDIRTPFLNRTEIQYLDGREATSTNRQGKTVCTVTMWNEDKSALITKADIETADGKPVELTITRKLSPDRKTMYLVTEFQVKDQECLQAVRVFHRSE